MDVSCVAPGAGSVQPSGGVKRSNDKEIDTIQPEPDQPIPVGYEVIQSYLKTLDSYSGCLQDVGS